MSMPNLAALAATLAALAAVAAPAQAFEPTRFSVVVEGEGPDVILIPGLASAGAVWREEAERLRGGHRLHLVQLAGFAREPAGAAAEGEVIAPAIAELAAYIEAEGLDDPTVIGHSLGGLVALLLARDHAEGVGRVVIVDALPYYGVLTNPEATAETLTPLATTLRDSLLGTDADAYAAQQRAAADFYVRTPARREEVLDWSLTSDRSVLARAIYEDMTTDLRGDIAAIATPLLVIYAYAPEMGGRERVDALYRGAYAAAQDVRFVPVTDSFHFVPLDQPEALHQAIEEFLP